MAFPRITLTCWHSQCYIRINWITVILFLALVFNKVLCLPCEEEEGSVVFCQNVMMSDSAMLSSRVDIRVEANPCHHPTDVTFYIKCLNGSWWWRHSFVNADEIQQVAGPAQYTLLQVTIQRPLNNTLYVQAHFVVNGEKQTGFLDHKFTAPENITCPLLLRQVSRTVKDLLPLIVFVTLCLLIVFTLTVFSLWYLFKRRNQAKPKKHHQLQVKQMVPGSRPVSGTYSYVDEEYIDEKKKKSRQSRASTTIIRNSIYRESLLLDDGSSSPFTFFTHEDDVKFNSLPRHFGGGCDKAWLPADDALSMNETRTLPRKGFESPSPPKEISAKEYLDIHSGTSQPHYSATLFQSFRGGTTNSPHKKANSRCPPARRVTETLSNSTSSFSNSSSPQTPTNGRQKRNAAKKKREMEDNGKRLSSVRLLNDHDHPDNDDYDDEDEDDPSDQDPLKSKY